MPVADGRSHRAAENRTTGQHDDAGDIPAIRGLHQAQAAQQVGSPETLDIVAFTTPILSGQVIVCTVY